MGLGPGGQPINANTVGGGGGMGSMGPGGQYLDVYNCAINYTDSQFINRCAIMCSPMCYLGSSTHCSYLFFSSTVMYVECPSMCVEQC